MSRRVQDKVKWVTVLFVVGMCIVTTLVHTNLARANEELPFPINYFNRALADRDASARRAAVYRIEQEFASHPKAFEYIVHTIERLSNRDPDGETAVRLVRSLRRFRGAEVGDFAAGLLDSTDYRRVIAALDVLARRRDSHILPHLVKLSERPEFATHYGFRIAVLRAVIAVRTPESIDFLLQQLPNLDGQSSYIVRQYLARISGLIEESTPDDWERWWEGVDKPGFLYQAIPPVNKPDQRHLASGSREFFGLSIVANRLVFVLDKSESMKNLVVPVGGAPNAVPVETRLVRAKGELSQAIMSLPVESHFGIITFDQRVYKWQPRLLQATEANKHHALKFVESITASGDTAWFDAIEAALNMDLNTEAIFFLTDGIPTTGKISSAALIVDAVEELNFVRGVTMNTIGLAVEPMAHRFLKILAAENAGDFQAIGKHVHAQKADDERNANEFTPEVSFTPPMPPILRPRAFDAATASKRVRPDELVLGVAHGDEFRAYPLNMLTGPNREIINDTLGGEEIAVTWCHLCHHGVVFSRHLDDSVVILVVSGLLWNDNLVMLDVNTRSLWSQILGKALDGKLKGKNLKRLPATITDWKTWRSAHPKTTALLLNRTAKIYDRKFHRPLSDFVLGATTREASRAWPFNTLFHEQVINDQFAGRPVLVIMNEPSMSPLLFGRELDNKELTFRWQDGQVLDLQTQSTWNIQTGRASGGPLEGKALPEIVSTLSFREHWHIFHPDSTVYGDE